MTKARVQLLTLLAMSLSVLAIVCVAGPTTASTQEESAKQGAPVSDPLIKGIVDYRQWARANEKPLPVFDSSVAG